MCVALLQSQWLKCNVQHVVGQHEGVDISAARTQSTYGESGVPTGEPRGERRSRKAFPQPPPGDEGMKKVVIVFCWKDYFYSAAAWLAMQSAILAMIDSDHFITVRYHAKMTPATIMRSSLEDSPMTLVSSRLSSSRNSKRNIGSEGAEWERGGKNVAKVGNF